MTQPDLLAQAAVSRITSDMTVGLGTGRAAARAIHALAHRVQTEGLKITCVATSKASEDLGLSLGLIVKQLPDVDVVDILFDGADEVDTNLFMVKGGGAAMTRERIVAHCARDRIYLIDSSKLAPRLGTKARLPIEVLPLARKLVEFEVSESLGFDGEYRQRKLEGSSDSVDLITDNGNLIFDITIPPALASDEESLYEMDNDLKTLPGVVDHGLFLLECQTLLIEWPGGRIETRQRDDEN